MFNGHLITCPASTSAFSHSVMSTKQLGVLHHHVFVRVFLAQIILFFTTNEVSLLLVSCTLSGGIPLNHFTVLRSLLRGSGASPANFKHGFTRAILFLGPPFDQQRAKGR